VIGVHGTNNLMGDLMGKLIWKDTSEDSKDLRLVNPEAVDW